MKFRISLVLLTLAMAMSTAVSARTYECLNITIKESYAFTIRGQILTPNGQLLIDGIAKTTFDGNGNFTQVDAVAVNGVLPLVWRTGTGSYSVSSDCTGTMTLINPNQPPLHLAILVSRSGDVIHTVVTDQGVAVTSDAERVVAAKSED